MSGSSAPTVFEIPLAAQPMTFTIPLGGVTYELTMVYRDATEGGWSLDIDDGYGNPILCGVPLVTGADLLAQYAYLGIGGQLWVRSDGEPDAVPTFANLGQVPGGHLYWIPNP
jgi:hypothetical protein